jgi:hypothetical protein
MVQRAEDILVLVSGGTGKYPTVIPAFRRTVPVTREIERADGRLVSSV